MDDDQFEDYVGTEEVIQETKQEGQGQKQQQIVKETIVDSIEIRMENDENEQVDNENNQTHSMGTQDPIVRAIKAQEISIHEQSQFTNQQQDQKPFQHHQLERPQQKQDFTHQVESNLFPIETLKTQTAQTAIELHEQTVFQNIQQKAADKSVDSSLNEAKNQQIQVHGSLINEEISQNDVDDGSMIDNHSMMNELIHPPINQVENIQDYQSSTVEINQELAPIQFQNQSHGQKLQSNPDLSIGTMNLDPLNSINQNLSLESYEQSILQHHGTHFDVSPPQRQTKYESTLIEQQIVQNDKILNDYQTNKQNNLTQNSHQQTNQIQNEQTNENQAQQEQDDEFGDFETYQQSTNQIPIAQITPQQQQQASTNQIPIAQITPQQKSQASNSIQYQSQSNHQQINSLNQAADQMTLNIHPHQTQSFTQQNYLYTGKNISNNKQVQQTVIHSQISKEAQVYEPNQKFLTVQPQQNQNLEPKIQQLVPKQLTLQDEIAAFINSLPNYKRICQKVFYNPA